MLSHEARHCDGGGGVLSHGPWHVQLTPGKPGHAGRSRSPSAQRPSAPRTCVGSSRRPPRGSWAPQAGAETAAETTRLRAVPPAAGTAGLLLRGPHPGAWGAGGCSGGNSEPQGMERRVFLRASQTSGSGNALRPKLPTRESLCGPQTARAALGNCPPRGARCSGSGGTGGGGGRASQAVLCPVFSRVSLSHRRRTPPTSWGRAAAGRCWPGPNPVPARTGDAACAVSSTGTGRAARSPRVTSGRALQILCGGNSGVTRISCNIRCQPLKPCHRPESP